MTRKTSLSAVVAVGAFFAFGATAEAAPVSAAIAAQTANPAAQDFSHVAPVQYRGRGYHRGRGWHRGRGYRGGRHSRRGWVGPAIAGLIIGGGIAASRRSYGYGYGGARERCASRYRSFRWSDGTFQPYGGGPRQLCPYLR